MRQHNVAFYLSFSALLIAYLDIIPQNFHKSTPFLPKPLNPACEARHGCHYAVALQTHRWHDYHALFLQGSIRLDDSCFCPFLTFSKHYCPSPPFVL